MLQVDTAPDLYVRGMLTLIKISGDRAFKSRLGLHIFWKALDSCIIFPVTSALAAGIHVP